MASTTEIGHSKNVSNFETLITFCKGYGADYKPSQPNREIAALQAKHAEAKSAVSDVTKCLLQTAKQSKTATLHLNH
jgi:hypothetical protein